MNRSLAARLGFVGVLALVLTLGVVQLGAPAPAAAGTCICPTYMFYPGCGFTNSFTYTSGGTNFKCCIYSCGVEYCGVDGSPGTC